jgi:hypothetical protein
VGFLTPASIPELPTRNHVQGSPGVTFAMVNANCYVDVIAAELGTLKKCHMAKTYEFGCRFVTQWYFVVYPSGRLDILQPKDLGNLQFSTEDQ